MAGVNLRRLAVTALLGCTLIASAVLAQPGVAASPQGSLLTGRSPDAAHLAQPWFPDVSAARRAIPYSLLDALYDILSLVHILEIGSPALATPVANHLPPCGSDFAIESNKNAYEGAINTRDAALTFLKLVNIRELRSLRGERDCVGEMILFGGAQRVSHYRMLEIGSYIAVDVRVAPN